MLTCLTKQVLQRCSVAALQNAFKHNFPMPSKTSSFFHTTDIERSLPRPQGTRRALHIRKDTRDHQRRPEWVRRNERNFPEKEKIRPNPPKKSLRDTALHNHARSP